MSESTRKELLQLTPDVYLADGFHGADGAPRPELTDRCATAAANQLLAAQVSPPEFGFVVEGIRAILPLRDEADPAARAREAVREATEVVVRMIKQPVNERMRLWLYTCAEAVADEADLAAFQLHLDAVMRQYGAMVALLTNTTRGVPPAP